MLPPPSEDNRIADLQRRIENLETSLRAAFTTISGGKGLVVTAGSKMRVEHPNGSTMVHSGLYDYNHGFDLPDGSYQPMHLLYRADGTLALAMYDPLPGSGGFQQFLAMFDRAGNVTISDDTDSGQGLARPWLAGGFARARYVDMSVSTTSPAWETLWDASLDKQQPKLIVGYRATMDTAGTSGETQVLVNDVPLGPVTAEGFTIATRFVGPGPVAGVHTSTLNVKVQGRRTSAGGGLRVEPLGWWGRQS
ncbi:hypothetical protein [Blastococcus sp. CT_GayMR16]|uniref:hypothetical protein n=1 Tax=Blastococcus sp. CT_GayMR16 TaxID=2559607 RepID=UPI0010748E88|nr:hypothetical protein [Blastococcus sp. CT_GayMR16]TFV83165.1 hypothetical protein E4P38_21145 [Blastococcus sp. CT_GayMR16]